MMTLATNIRPAALASMIMVLPLALLETAFGRGARDPASLAVLFGLLWLMPTTFLLVALPMVRNARAGGRMTASSLSFLVQGAVLVLVAVLWVSLLTDQAPCFMGLPNCD